MDIRFEQRVLHNPLLSGLVMWRFVRAYYDATNQSEAPDLRTSLLVLPMTLHKRTVGLIHRMHKTSGLAKALTDDPLIRVGLQERVDDFTDLSFRAIHLGCCAGLMALDRTGKMALLGTNIDCEEHSQRSGSHIRGCQKHDPYCRATRLVVCGHGL